MKEEELIRCCQQWHAKAQETVYELYADRLYRLVQRYVRDTAEAEEVLMNAFLKAFKHIQSFAYQSPGSFEGWLRKIVVNESLMWLRRNHNFNLVESIDDTLPEPGLLPFSSMESDDIYHFITQLPTGYRTVFNLFVVEGFDHAEIAAMLSISEVTSRSQLFKAKAMLKKMLTQEGYHYGT